jgi:hypothetical protein
MPARRMGCWMLRRVVRGVVIGPEGAIVAVFEWYLQSRWFEGSGRKIKVVQRREKHVK